MTTSSWWAIGSQLQLGDGATSEAFTAIAELTELVPPSQTKDSIDVSNHGSTNKFKEFLPGMKDSGSISFKANWLPTNATHAAVLAAFVDDNNHNWKLILPNTLKTLSFSGHVTAFSPETPLTAQGALSCTIKITGQITYS